MKKSPVDVAEIVRNVLELAGFASIIVGLWWLNPAASLIVGGTIVVGARFAGTYRQRRKESR